MASLYGNLFRSLRLIRAGWAALSLAIIIAALATCSYRKYHEPTG